MSSLSFGLSVSVVGILVVFAGLVILILFLKLFEVLFKERAKKAPAVTPEAKAAVVPAEPIAEEGIAPEVIAAITAAVSAVWQEENTGFIVRRVRRIHSAPAWNRAGRDDQVYSRL